VFLTAFCNPLCSTIYTACTAPQVYSVDCNPAQSALLELKQVAIRELEYEDVWALFGEGKVGGRRGIKARGGGWDGCWELVGHAGCLQLPCTLC
jgi:hypothetical protein